MVYHNDGYIYVPTGNAFEITRINVATEAIDTIEVPPGMLRWENATPTNGPVYLTSDGQYIYNITLFDEQGNSKYTLRTFEPANGWALAKPDMIQVVNGLPKTRSGKIMRRILRKIGEGDATNLGDTSTLLDPGVVEDIITGAKVEVKR